MCFHENKPIDDANEENSVVFVKMMNIVRNNDNFCRHFLSTRGKLREKCE